MRSTRRAAIVALLLAACSEPPESTPEAAARPDSAAAPADGDGAVPAAAADARDGLIDTLGIGAATRGATVADVRRRLQGGESLIGPVSDFMVDIDAMHVVAGADTIYTLVFPAGDRIDEATELELVATKSTRHRTIDGVGPGTMLSDAVNVYGPATISYNVDNESREFAEFARLPDSRLLFRVMGDAGSFAGSYATDTTFVTTSFRPDARITMVLVDVRR